MQSVRSVQGRKGKGEAEAEGSQKRGKKGERETEREKVLLEAFFESLDLYETL